MTTVEDAEAFVDKILAYNNINSYGEWTKVGTNSDDDVFYIDLERIKKIDNYVYCKII